MKFKEIETTANVVWSPQQFYPVMLAAGSAAQHVDASFSSSANLGIYSLNLNDPGYEMEQKVSIPSDHKFQKLVWSSGGILVGGCDGGLLKFYNVHNMLNNKDPLVSSNTTHTGSVSALDLNPFQNNLFSSGAADSEIYIWDLNNTSKPMAPGNKSQPNEPVQALTWNRQVQHILASAFSTRCVVWDLRKNEPIIKLSDGQARTRWKAAAWHPSVATQICLASEDDSTPVVQLWDLRLATSPLLTLERHQKGVLALSWCQQDPDLLLSASKDGKVLCWNPNNNIPGGEVLSEICSTGQWTYDVAWCPKNPNLVAACSNDGRVGIYSINGGSHLQPVATSNKIMDSFPGMESFHQAPVPSMAEVHTSPQILPRPPLWFKTPIRARFGFGGKLVTFINQQQTNQNSTGQNGTTPHCEIFISQVITEPDLITQAHTLQEIIKAGESEGAASILSDYCSRRGEQVVDQHEKYIWHFLKANFIQNPRLEMLNLLGFRQDDMNNKLNVHYSKVNNKYQSHIDGQIENLSERLSGLSRSESSETEAEPSTDTSTDISGVDGINAFDNITRSTDVKPVIKPFTIPLGDDSEGLICQALLSGNVEIAVEFCMDAGRTTDALIIASAAGGDLLRRTQWRYLSRCTGPVSSLSLALLDGKWSEFAAGVSPNGWKAALAAALTHCSANQLYSVCETLGQKLDKESDPALHRDAVICYLCSASVEELVSRWQHELENKGNTSKSLARIAELVLIARLAAIQRGRPTEVSGKLSNFLVNYAMRLASQGYFEGALMCLTGIQDDDMIYRIQCAMGYAQPYPKQATNQRGAPVQQQNQWGGAGNRVRTSSYNSQSNYIPNNINQMPSYNNVTDSAPPIGFKPPAQPLPSQPMVPQPMVPQPVTPQQPPLQQPPRPTSASSHGGLMGRNKYVRDPSVQSGPGMYQPPIDSQPGFGNRGGFIPGVAPVQSSFNPQSNPALNPQAPYAPIQTAFNTAHNYNQPPAPMAPAPSIPNNVGYPTTMMTPDMPNSMTSSNMYGNTEMGTEAVQAASYSAASSGWNDPPALSASTKSQAKPEFVPAAPITHPLYATPQHVPLSGPPQYQDPVSQIPQGYGSVMPNQGSMPGMMPNQVPMPGMMPNQVGMPGMMPNHQAPPPVVENIAPVPSAPIQKPPIPEEHIHMQTVFDALRAECAQTTNNPQIKRKLDDVQKKLETLYDLLRENKLSPNALSTLHQVVQLVQVGDYGNSLASLTALASGPDFSTVASFLPSLKIMIQTASNAQIYLR